MMHAETTLAGGESAVIEQIQYLEFDLVDVSSGAVNTWPEHNVVEES